ncbi:MAG: DUF3459 domain-containing protein [Hymenobacter sp.]|nr:MAG: DUF3459 domain-containing protein [Hymenobacter sp.]
MQWDASANAGFTTGTPWLAVNPNYPTVNAAAQEQDLTSVLNHFRQAIILRKQRKELVYGQYQLLDAANPHVYAYARTLGADKTLVVLNFSAAPRTWTIPSEWQRTGKPLLNNYATLSTGAALALEPWQAVVLQLK